MRACGLPAVEWTPSVRQQFLLAVLSGRLGLLRVVFSFVVSRSFFFGEVRFFLFCVGSCKDSRLPPSLLRVCTVRLWLPLASPSHFLQKDFRPPPSLDLLRCSVLSSVVDRRWRPLAAHSSGYLQLSITRGGCSWWSWVLHVFGVVCVGWDRTCEWIGHEVSPCSPLVCRKDVHPCFGHRHPRYW